MTVIVDASEAEEFSEVGVKPLKSLPYDTPAQTFVAFERPEGVPSVGKFSNTLRFTVKEVYSPCLVVFKFATCMIALGNPFSVIYINIFTWIHKPL